MEPHRPAGLEPLSQPVPVISGPTEWSRLLDDAKFLTEYHDVLADVRPLHGERLRPLVPARYADELSGPIAYFCAEYGLHESLGIYSGGLGVLAGDHMKTAATWPSRRSASACSTATGTSASRSTPTGTRSTTTPTTT